MSFPRAAWLSVAWAALLAASCREKPSEGHSARAETRELLAWGGEDALLARRDALLANRRQLREKQAALASERQALLARGGDTAELDKREAQLRQRERELFEEERRLYELLDTALHQYRVRVETLATAADPGTRMTARESAVAVRERALAQREDRLAAREAALSQREREIVRYKQEACAATPTTIIRTLGGRGARYTKEDVDPLIEQARRKMTQKGILSSDLAAPAQDLEREATAAMAEGDYGRARFAAAQLLATVEATEIDKAFIAAKIKRLSALMRGKTLSAEAQRQIDELFREATAQYGDGRFAGANRRLNRIYATVR